MVKTVLKIQGMACSMCEAHVNDVIRKIIPGAQKVKSSHVKEESSFYSEAAPDLETLKAEIAKTGYTVTATSSEEIQKRHFGFKKTLHR